MFGKNMTERRSINEKLTIGSLFSGIGGIELGLERTGYFKTKWQCEINDYARRVLAKHWPGLPIYNDVKELYETEFPEKVDVLCGGFPCQPFSTAGKRRGEQDERFLWPEFVRIVREVRPRWVVAENVPGLLTIDAGRVFGRILWDLASCGYDAEWDTISAASVGALHPRNRIFIVGRMADPEHFGRDASEVEGGIGAGSHCHQAGTVATMQPSGLRVERPILADPDRGPAGMYPGAIPEEKGTLRRGAQGDLSSGCRAVLADAEGEGRECWTTQEREQHPQCGEGIPGRSDSGIFGRPPEPRNDWAIEPDVGRVANGIPHRVDRLRCLGNAVVPQCAQYIGECIIEYERGPIMTHEVEWIDEKEDR